MPNWCQNKLTVFGPHNLVKTFINKAHGPNQHGHVREFSFHQFVPIPEDILNKPYDPYGYEAENDLWGMKWGASDCRLDSFRVIEKLTNKDGVYLGVAHYQFRTPWSCPEYFLEQVSKDYEHLTFLSSYGEEYPTRGRFIICNGEVLEEEHDQPDGKDSRRYSWGNVYLKEHRKWVKTKIGIY